jgi:predicted dienelactone hydrolase
MKRIKIIIITILFLPELSIGQDYHVGELTINLVDSTRDRLVKTEIWYPTMDTDSGNLRVTELPFIIEPTIRNAEFINQKYPLIVISHGTGGNRFSLAWLAITLVKHGYVVAACDHWGNTFDNKIPKYFVKYWERPLDITFLITQILSNNPLSKYIDSERIGAVGFSFGGYTSLALAGVEMGCEYLKNKVNTSEGKREFSIPELGDLRKLIKKLPCDSVSKLPLKDTRIKAFVALAPALGLGIESAEQSKNVTSPILIIGAQDDQIAPVLTNAKKYNFIISTSEYVELEGKIGHYIFLNEGDKNLKKEAKTYYRDDKSVNRILIHEKLDDIILNFFKKKLR